LPLTKLHIDNQGCIRLITNEQVKAKTKHLDIKLHHVREMVNKEIILSYVPSEEQIADILTKPLSCKVFQRLRSNYIIPLADEVNTAIEESCVMPSQSRNCALFAAVLFSLLPGSFLAFHNSQEQFIDVDLNSPCQELKTTVEEQGFKGMIFNYPEKALKYRKFAIESYNDFVIDQCQKRYDYTIQSLLGELETCVPHRFKRDIANYIGRAVRLAGGVTNLIESAFEKPSGFNDTTMSRLGNVVSALTKSLFSDPKRRALMELKDVAAASETAALHEETLYKCSKNSNRNYSGLNFTQPEN